MALTVFPSAEQYQAAQYDGMNAADLVAALAATNVEESGGVLAFDSFQQYVGLRRSGHRSYVPTGHWVVWLAADHAYVVAVVSPAEFADQWQGICDCTGLAAQVDALDDRVDDLETAVVDLGADKVDVAGDTMTGELVMGATSPNLRVGEALMSVMSTGLLHGGELNINADPTKLDITAGVGYVVDYVTTPAAPTLVRVAFPAQIGITPTGPQVVTWWLMTSAGALVQQATAPTYVQRRTHLVLGVTATFAGVVTIDQSIPGWYASQPGAQLTDLMEALGPFRIQGSAGGGGLVISPNGVNRQINCTDGALFARYFNLYSGPTLTNNPSVSQLVAQTPCTFRYASAVAAVGGLTTLVDVANYDPNGLGVITPIGGGANSTTIHRVYAFASNTASGQLALQYGQNVYGSLAAATAAIGSGVFKQNPSFSNGALIGFIAAIRTATDLSDPLQATFTRAGLFASA
jgi:hypothetical protein